MTGTRSPESAESRCDVCRRPTRPDGLSRQRTGRLCDDCHMEACLPRVRKTHWQYIGSIKGDYLRPSPRPKKDR